MNIWTHIGLVASALGLTIAQAEAGTAYVPLGTAGEVIVIDTSTDTVIGTIPGLEQAHGLGGTPASPYLAAGSFAEVAPGAVTLGPAPEGMTEDEHAAHHTPPVDRPAAEAHAPISILTVLRAEDRAVVRRLEVPGAVHHVAVAPDGRHAVAVHTHAGGISVTDLETFTVSEPIPTGAMPNYVVFTADGALAYVSNAGDGTVSEIETEGWQVRRELPADESPEHMVLSPDDDMLYVANVHAGTVSIVCLVRGEVVRTLTIGGVLHGLDLSEDGGTLFVSDLGADRLVAIELASGRQRSQALSPAPYHVAVVPGTSKLYVSSRAEPKIWVVDQASLAPITTIPIRGEGHQMVVFE
jgi:DNA-binding beta-propeller fold protein YncE